MTPRVNTEERVIEYSGLDIGGILRSILDALSGNPDAIIERLAGWWEIFSVIALILSFLFFLGFIYARIRFGQLREIQDANLAEAEAEWARLHGGGATGTNTRWADITLHVTTENPNDWKLAIIEADIMLDEVLEKAGLVGDTIGEKLKSANRASFQTLQDAWEAHKVRNEIAHAGTDFVLTKKLAQETIVRYERVFREFGAV